MKVSDNTLKLANVVKRDFNANGRPERINKLYMELYAMDEPYIEGVYEMVKQAFYECWQAQGSHTKHLEKIVEDSLPENTWRVGGSLEKKNTLFNGEQIIEARILAMLSYIRLTEVKYLEGYVREQQEQ